MSPPVRLRPVSQADLPIFFEQQLDPAATAMAAFPARDREAFMAHWARIMANAALIQRTILFEDQVAGNIVSWEQDGEQEVGYWLGREFWGKGIATAALAELLKELSIRPLVAHVASHNVGSRRVLEKCGFQFVRSYKFLDRQGTEIEEYILKLDS